MSVTEGSSLEITFPDEFADEVTNGNAEAEVRFKMTVGRSLVLGQPDKGTKEFGVSYINNLLEGIVAAFHEEGHLACFAEDVTCLVFQPVVGKDLVVVSKYIRSPRAREMASPRTDVPEEFDDWYPQGVADTCTLAHEVITAGSRLRERIISINPSCAESPLVTEFDSLIGQARQLYAAECE